MNTNNIIPKISVIMPVHRNDKFIDTAIQSVLTQSFNDFEFIIVENGGNDILWNKLLSMKDSRIRLFRSHIKQLCFNLNFAINEARSDLIIRMDSDDICTPDRFQKQFEIMMKNKKIAVCGSNTQLINEKDEFLELRKYPEFSLNIRKKISFSNPFCHPSVILRKHVLIENGGYSGGFSSEDYDLWLRLIRNSEYEFYNIQESLLKYRVHSNSAQRKKLPYSEVASYFLREFLLKPSIKGFYYTILNSLKILFRKSEK